MPPMLASAPGSIGKNRPGALDLVVELLARDARLHRHRQVFGVDGQHLVHAADVDADAALHRQQMPFQRRADAVGNHRHLVRGAQLDRIGHVGRAFGKHHGGRRRHGGEGRFVAPVLLAHRQRFGELRAEAAFQCVDQRGGDRAQNPGFGGRRSACGHGGLLKRSPARALSAQT
jgi:hypothetical protein